MVVAPEESPDSKLSVGFGAAGPWLTAEVCGELDLGTAPVLLNRVGLLIGLHAAPHVALDVSRVAFCDSSGINAFVRLVRRARAAGGQLVLLRPPPRLAELLARTGVDRHVRIVDTLPG
ncbi:STAS domain-containing protein [Actinomadura sp. NPDC047616]|uniref:STAS domain-containing protein n=1 Tax=Actinomadura sp. NPDC047616 TaxID=3155914 RepID=UPI0033E94835